jgi:hypothetical protein
MLALGTAFLWAVVKVRDIVHREPRAVAELEPAPPAVELRIA